VLPLSCRGTKLLAPFFDKPVEIAILAQNLKIEVEDLKKEAFPTGPNILKNLCPKFFITKKKFLSPIF
jgi:hypothetical protein